MTANSNIIYCRIIDLSASHNNEKGHRKPEISVKPLFYFENIPKDVQKLVKVLVTSSNANAASYLPYSELCQGKPSLTQSNFKFLDLKNIQKCLEGNTLVLFIDVSFCQIIHVATSPLD